MTIQNNIIQDPNDFRFRLKVLLIIEGLYSQSVHQSFEKMEWDLWDKFIPYLAIGIKRILSSPGFEYLKKLRPELPQNPDSIDINTWDGGLDYGLIDEHIKCPKYESKLKELFITEIESKDVKIEDEDLENFINSSGEFINDIFRSLPHENKDGIEISTKERFPNLLKLLDKWLGNQNSEKKEESYISTEKAGINENDSLGNAISYCIIVDIVKYSLRPMHISSILIKNFNHIIQKSITDCKLKNDDLFLKSTGDGVIIVFKKLPAHHGIVLDLSFSIQKNLKERNINFSSIDNDPNMMEVRIGINQGTYEFVKDMVNSDDICGELINNCERIASIGEEWHILASSSAQQSLVNFDKNCENFFHHIGKYSAKHGKIFDIYNVYCEEKDIGNSENPPKTKPKDKSDIVSPRNKNTENNKAVNNNIIGIKPTVFFETRLCESFPGIRGLSWIDNPKEAIDGLQLLLKKPLRFESAEGFGIHMDPIWWFRGDSSMYIEDFRKLNSTRCLLNVKELEIDRIAVYHDNSYYNSFIYVETKADNPIGINDYDEDDIKRMIESHGFASEEYGLYDGRPITRACYDDGAVNIDGKVFDASGAQLRIRYLSSFNFILTSKFSPINRPGLGISLNKIFNKLLKDETEVEELIEFVEGLPRHENDI